MRTLAWPTETPWNPYTALVYSSLGSRVSVDSWPGNMLRRYDIWHVHWPDSLLNIPNNFHAAIKVSGFFAATDFMRSRGTKLVWTMHNFASHEALHRKIEPWFWKQFIPRVDGAISLSNAGLSAAMEKFPPLRKIPTVVIRHGHYRDQYPPPAKDVRPRLGIPPDAKVVMFFGAVRPYKNVDLLVDAFRKISTPNALLYIVGKPNSEQLADLLRQKAATDPRIRLNFEFVANRDVFSYLSAADVVVLPYREVLNSGSALLSLSCSRPVVVPELGAMGELKEDFSGEWVRTFRGEIEPSVLDDALNWSAQPRPNVCAMPPSYEWKHIGSQTLALYEAVLKNTPQAARDVLVEMERTGR